MKFDKINIQLRVLNEKQEIRTDDDSASKVREIEYPFTESSYNLLENDKTKSFKRFNAFYLFTLILLAAKIVLFAFWNYKNANNIVSNAIWGKKISSPIWAFASWIIPLYNLIKPFSLNREIFEDTEWLLKEKEIVPENYNQNDSNNFYLELWWVFLLLAICITPLFVKGTFFGTGVLFHKLNHFNVMFCVLVLWAIYLFLECFVIFRYNKMNKLLVDNQDKL